VQPLLLLRLHLQSPAGPTLAQLQHQQPLVLLLPLGLWRQATAVLLFWVTQMQRQMWV
jgi:hypothetical protein